MKTVCYLFAAWVGLCSWASADIVGNFVPLASEDGVPVPAGFVAQDLAVSTPTDWTGANLIITLSEGSIHQDPLGIGITPPNPLLFGVFPELRFDTYLTGKNGLAGGSPSSAGGAVDLGGTMAGAFTSDHIDINWFTTTNDDIGDFTLGRFVLSEDAHGTFMLRLDAIGQSAPFLLSGRVARGTLTLVPEPGGLVLGVLGSLLAAAIWRRRRLPAR